MYALLAAVLLFTIFILISTEPSAPRITNTIKKTRNVTITWLPPEHPNGHIIHYVVTWWSRNGDREHGSAQIDAPTELHCSYTIDKLGD